MSELFLTSDTHFGHKNILGFEPGRAHFASIEEHDQALVDNWNRVVGKNDEVWDLGDVVWKKRDLPILGRLHGRKHLVMGNHDNFGYSHYAPYFQSLVAMRQKDRVAFTHIPIHPAQFERYRANVHGHLHSRTLDDPRYVNVSIEQWKLAPVAFETLCRRHPVVALSRADADGATRLDTAGCGA